MLFRNKQPLAAILILAIVSSSAFGENVAGGVARSKSHPLFTPTRIKRNLPEVTLFALPYVGTERTVVVGDLSPIRAQFKGSNTAENNSKSAPVNYAPPTPENVDYGVALRFVPFEIVMADAVVIDGHRFQKGEAFSTVIPLSRIHPELYPDPKMLPSAEQLVTCTYIIRDIGNDEIQLTVVADGRFAARDQYVVYSMARTSTIPGL